MTTQQAGVAVRRNERSLAAMGDARRVRLVCIDVHLESEGRADADRHVAKDGGPRSVSQLDVDQVAVIEPAACRLFRADMDMAPGDDEAVGPDAACRPFQADVWRSLEVVT